MKRRPLWSAGISASGFALWMLLHGVPLPAQEAVGPSSSSLTSEQFDQQSLALRTALFHDPSLEAPLQNLTSLYEKAGRAEELIGLYSQHVAQYPEDAGSRAVLIRILQEWRRPEAAVVAQAAVEAHPEHPLINYLRYRGLAAQQDPRALDYLVRAAELETEPHRKKAWTEELAEHAQKAGRPEVAEATLRALITAPNQTAEALAALARRLQREGYSALAFEAAEAGLARSPAPEVGVELTLQAAAAEASLDKKAEAGARLDALLKRVAADYARRGEIVSRRVALMESSEERAAKLAEARAAWEAAPTSETAALELAEWLIACELRREALRVLREAGEKLPQSTRIEQAVLELLDRLADERGVAEYLEERVTLQPHREDLAWRRVRALYALGARQEAAAAFETLLARLDEPAQLARRLDLGRALMRLNMPAEAAAEFAKVLAADPKRLEVRRELAEARLAAGDRLGADQLLREALAPDAEIENFLDIIGFMRSRQQWAEMRTALEARRAAQPKQFEVAMLLLEVLTQLGDVAAAEALREEIRLLTDTDARFRRWLEGAKALAEVAGTEAEFFQAEQQRLVDEAKAAPDGWSPQRASRYLTLCEMAKSGPAEPALIETLKARLAEPHVPLELRVPLRRLLAEALRRDPKQVVEARQQWQLLIQEDEVQADTYRLELARSLHEELNARGGDARMVQALLEQTDVLRVQEAAVLASGVQLFLDYNLAEHALVALQRLTELEPAELRHWEKWIAALAGMGDEERLRGALRQVLAGATQAELSSEVLELVRGHLVDSCWRSVAALMSEPVASTSRLAEALVLLDVIERSGASSHEPHWSLWARAWVLRRLGRTEAAQEAETLLEQYASRRVAESGQPQPLRFPDGLAMSIDQALATLRDTAPVAALLAESSQGPDRPPEVHWGFHTPAGASVVQVIAPEEGQAVFVLDERGTLHALDGRTGKLVWQQEGVWRSAGRQPRVRGRAGIRLTGATMTDGQWLVTVPPRLVWTRDGSRLFLSHEGRISARSGTDGAIVWENRLEGLSHRATPQPGQPQPLPLTDELFLDHDGRVVVWRPEIAVAAAFHPETGKMLWSRFLGRDKPPATGPVSAGAACAGNVLLVYGQVPAVLDTATGAVRWSFDSTGLREFPLTLSSLGSALPSAASLVVTGNMGPRRLSMNYLRGENERALSLREWMANQGVLVAPATAWAEQENVPLNGAVVGNRLLLSMPALVMAPSLTLPLGGGRFNVGGTFLGAASQRAVFLDYDNLSVLDLTKGRVFSASLRDLMERAGLSFPSSESRRWEGVVAGPRVYVSGPEGLLCYNPLTSQVLYTMAWPEKVRQRAGLNQPAVTATPEMASEQWQYLPRYCVRSRSGEAKAIFPRGAARGEMLWTVLADNYVVALAVPSRESSATRSE